MSAPKGLLLVAVASLVLTTGCPGKSAVSPPEPPQTSSDAPLLQLPVQRYVALGDSYTAGPLVPWVGTDPTFCLRSSRNYPAVLAQWLSAQRVVDVSCSGTDTGDLRDQARALTADTDLVTVGIGGNDLDLFARLVSGERSPRLLEILDQIGARVARALAMVTQRAPEAVVALLGYPRIVPMTGTCSQLPFRPGVYRFLDRVQRALNQQLREAAAESGAVYVDTYAASRGHDVCAGAHAWVNGSQTQPLRALAYHPFQAGMTGMATVLHTALLGESPTARDRQQARKALAPRPPDALTRPAQRVIAALLGG